MTNSKIIFCFVIELSYNKAYSSLLILITYKLSKRAKNKNMVGLRWARYIECISNISSVVTNLTEFHKLK